MAAFKLHLHITQLLDKTTAIYSNGNTYGVMLPNGAICSWSYAVAILGFHFRLGRSVSEVEPLGSLTRKWRKGKNIDTAVGISLLTCIGLPSEICLILHPLPVTGRLAFLAFHLIFQVWLYSIYISPIKYLDPENNSIASGMLMLSCVQAMIFQG